ncbi:putative transposase of the Rover hAT-like DNA transposon [Lachancea lanzarotensis]|uniref:LALA0S02e05358g1_1 n=1 Tax=Lachancea lanzarotensis TaxID=1245769 RepID=A0A0C7MMJ6_9SACH|nr:putative transposase of the Rover hAT-like DNA transposon [Lachancea lanzarotensis]CEP61038.1 putative transposase of the Rover hAT-like DNA transposon [Lachancea lanzarotensis]
MQGPYQIALMDYLPDIGEHECTLDHNTDFEGDTVLTGRENGIHSIGNFSKHIKGHRSARIQSLKATTMRERILNTQVVKSRPLPLPSDIVRECEHSPGSIATIGFLTEKLLPTSFVGSKMWKWICKACPEMSFIQSQTTLDAKLESYLEWLNQALKVAMEHTDFINIELNFWPSHEGTINVGISASFAPNLLNDKALQEVGDQALLNNCQEPYNSHLLDLVELPWLPDPEEDMDFEASDNFPVYEVLDRFNISHKVSSFTSHNDTNKIVIPYSNFEGITEHLEAKILINKENLHHIRCASHILNLLFQEIVRKLKEDQRFEEGLRNISAFAKAIKRSSVLRSALADAGLPLIPSAPKTQGIIIWKQIATFLKHHDDYAHWAKRSKSRAELFNYQTKIEGWFELPEETMQLFEYFTSCCSIFQIMSGNLQNNAANNIANAVTFYGTMREYYNLCSVGETENVETPPKGFFDFTFINGKSDLPEETKSTVLKAVISSRPTFDEYFDRYRKNDIYFVAAFLDPTIKESCFSELLTEQEGEYHFQRVEKYVKRYLRLCDPQKIPCIDYTLEPVKLNRVTKLPKPIVRPKQSVKRVSKVLEEWDTYKADSRLSSDSVTDAVRWWHSRRLIYPYLFPLAIGMMYTKLSTRGIERTYNTVEKSARSNHRHLGSDFEKKTILLRDRFSNFGLFDEKLLISRSNDLDDTSSDEQPSEYDDNDDEESYDDDDLDSHSAVGLAC